MEEKWEQARQKSEQREFEFEVEHLSIYQDHGFEWPPSLVEPDSDALDSVAVATLHMTRRRREVVCFHALKLADIVAEDADEFVVDTNLNLKWTQNFATMNVAPCIVATSKPWLFGRARDLTGPEALALQGFWMPAFRLLESECACV